MRNQKGITLIALVITIIVLLILAGVTIAMLSGENGILTRATTTKEANAEATAREQSNLAYMTVRTAIAAEKVKDGNFDPNGSVAALYDGTNSQTPHAYLATLCKSELGASNITGTLPANGADGWAVKDTGDTILLTYVNSSLKQTNHQLVYTINLVPATATITLTTGSYNQINS